MNYSLPPRTGERRRPRQIHPATAPAARSTPIDADRVNVRLDPPSRGVELTWIGPVALGVDPGVLAVVGVYVTPFSRATYSIT